MCSCLFIRPVRKKTGSYYGMVHVVCPSVRSSGRPSVRPLPFCPDNSSFIESREDAAFSWNGFCNLPMGKLRFKISKYAKLDWILDVSYAKTCEINPFEIELNQVFKWIDVHVSIWSIDLNYWYTHLVLYLCCIYTRGMSNICAIVKRPSANSRNPIRTHVRKLNEVVRCIIWFRNAGVYLLEEQR